MYSLRFVVCGRQESPTHGSQRLLRRRQCQFESDSSQSGDSHPISAILIKLIVQLYRKFRPDQTPPTELGRDRDYAVDLIPKFIIASGELTKILVHTDVTRYLEFKQIAGSFVYRDGRISKVPSTEMEAVRSPLMGLFEKRRAKKFFEFLQGWKDSDPATHQGKIFYLLEVDFIDRFFPGVDLDKDSMKSVYEKFGLEPGTQDFIGHAMALYLDDEYISNFKLTSSGH